MSVDRGFLLRGLAFWPVLPALAAANGVLRETLLAPALGARAALPLSGVLFVALVLGASAVFLALVRAPRTPGELWRLGALWAGLALAFEVGVFGLIGGVPMRELLAALDPATGNLFALALLATLAGPRLMAAARLKARARP